MDLTIRVTSTNFNIGSRQLHIAGKVAVKSKHMKLRSYHILDLKLQRKFTISKADKWDSMVVEILYKALDVTKHTKV